MKLVSGVRRVLKHAQLIREETLLRLVMDTGLGGCFVYKMTFCDFLTPTLLESLLSGSYVFLSVAVDLVIQEIREPVRFLVETQACVYSQNEKFWSFGKKILHEIFHVRLREVSCVGIHQTLVTNIK